MPKTDLETLFGLRPLDDRAATIAASIEKIQALEADASARAASIRDAYADGVLTLPAPELVRMAGEADALQSVSARAAEMVAKLAAKHHQVLAREAAVELVAAQTALEAKRAAFAQSFHAAYESFVDDFMVRIKHGEDLRRQTTIFNASVAAFAKTHGPHVSDAHPMIAPMALSPICAAYFNKVVLPHPNIDSLDGRWAPFAVAGSFWIAKDPEGPPPAMLAEMRAREREAIAKHLANRAANDLMVQQSRHEFEIQNRRTAEREAEQRMREEADSRFGFGNDGVQTAASGKHFLDKGRTPDSATGATPPARALPRPSYQVPKRPAPMPAAPIGPHDQAGGPLPSRPRGPMAHSKTTDADRGVEDGA